ncbi:MAG: YggS family pyridoxal phosphate-dependent enzyme [Proteobacteria bacterium]|nr:MAG: YggS family pyridoxal phosphate-dependent enzyme [Pseudomonadota bacterium]
MTIKDKLQTIGERIRAAELRYQRTLGSVKLLAVSKHHPVSAIQQAIACGQMAFGENYAQEMDDKATQLQQHSAEWHFIGPIQSNKTRLIANTASWVHSVDRLKIARRLGEQKPANTSDINICLQINISHEASKSGIPLAEAEDLAHQVIQLAGIRLRGLMAIPAPETDFTKQRACFAQLRQLLEKLNQQGLQLDTLSMGMTDDMEAAIAEGATIVRIGTAIFGNRHY